MSSPTIKLPTGYASLKYGGTPGGFTESTTNVGVMIMKAMSYDNEPEVNVIKGTTGFAAGLIEKKAASAGAGGTKFDDEKITMSFVHGEHASKSWPVALDVLTFSGMTGDDAKYNGDWKIMKENAAFARETEADKAYDFKRWCDIDLTP